jgi:hypothetical protein
MSKPVITLQALACDGPALRLRDLARITSLSKVTLLRDIQGGHLFAVKRPGATSVYLIQRSEARRYLVALGFHVERIATTATSATDRLQVPA